MEKPTHRDTEQELSSTPVEVRNEKGVQTQVGRLVDDMLQEHRLSLEKLAESTVAEATRKAEEQANAIIEAAREKAALIEAEATEKVGTEAKSIIEAAREKAALIEAEATEKAETEAKSIIEAAQEKAALIEAEATEKVEAEAKSIIEAAQEKATLIEAESKRTFNQIYQDFLSNVEGAVTQLKNEAGSIESDVKKPNQAIGKEAGSDFPNGDEPEGSLAATTEEDKTAEGDNEKEAESPPEPVSPSEGTITNSSDKLSPEPMESKGEVVDILTPEHQEPQENSGEGGQEGGTDPLAEPVNGNQGPQEIQPHSEDQAPVIQRLDTNANAVAEKENTHLYEGEVQLVVTTSKKKLDNTGVLFLLGELTSALNSFHWVESVATSASHSNNPTLIVRLSKPVPLLEHLKRLPRVRAATPLEQSRSSRKQDKGGGLLGMLGRSKSQDASKNPSRKEIIVILHT